MEIQWSLVVFTLLTGAGGWVLAGIAVNEFVRKSDRNPSYPVGIALALVIVGGFASVTHLSHPDRIMNALSNPLSGIFTEAALVGIVVVLGAVQLVLYRKEQAKAAKIVAVASAVFGAALSFMAGESYTVMTSRAAWDTMFLPLAYLGTAAPIGIGLYWASACPDEGDGFAFFARATGVCGILGAASLTVYALAVSLFPGEFGLLFMLAICLDAAVACVGLFRVNKSTAVRAWTVVLLAAASGALLRVLMWVVGSDVYGFFG